LGRSENAGDGDRAFRVGGHHDDLRRDGSGLGAVNKGADDLRHRLVVARRNVHEIAASRAPGSDALIPSLPST
jgi:hypothetical protein